MKNGMGPLVSVLITMTESMEPASYALQVPSSMAEAVFMGKTIVCNQTKSGMDFNVSVTKGIT